MSKPNEPKNPQLIIDRMKIRLEELQEQMPVIAELEARIEELEAENDHTAFDALAEKYELAKDKIKTLEADLTTAQQATDYEIKMHDQTKAVNVRQKKEINRLHFQVIGEAGE